MYKTDKTSPTGNKLWEYEIEFDREEGMYKIEDPRWQEIEFKEIISTSPYNIQKFRGKGALERNLENHDRWDFEGYEGDKMVYGCPAGFKVRFSDDLIEADTLGIEISDLMSYELEAWLHCNKQAYGLNEIIDIELSNS